MYLTKKLQIMNFWYSYDFCCEQIQYYEEQIVTLTKMIDENKIKERYEYKDLKKKIFEKATNNSFKFKANFKNWFK